MTTESRWGWHSGPRQPGAWSCLGDCRKARFWQGRSGVGVIPGSVCPHGHMGASCLSLLGLDERAHWGGWWLSPPQVGAASLRRLSRSCCPGAQSWQRELCPLVWVEVAAPCEAPSSPPGAGARVLLAACRGQEPTPTPSPRFHGAVWLRVLGPFLDESSAWAPGLAGPCLGVDVAHPCVHPCCRIQGGRQLHRCRSAVRITSVLETIAIWYK